MKKSIRIIYFSIACYWERLIFRWDSFWDCFRFKHFKKFEKKWKDRYNYPPNRDGYK